MAGNVDRGGMVMTPLTLHAAMKADPGLMEVGGHAYLAGLVQAAPAIPNVRDLARILHDLAVRRSLIGIGEDIVNTAYEAPIDTTRRLADIVARVVHSKPGTIHPATRTFQALRIFVNEELHELAGALAAAEHVLKEDGRLVVVGQPEGTRSLLW